MRAAITMTPPWGELFAPAQDIIFQRATWHSLFDTMAGDPCSGLLDRLCAGMRYLSYPPAEIWTLVIAATIASIFFDIRWSRRDMIRIAPARS